MGSLHHATGAGWVFAGSADALRRRFIAQHIEIVYFVGVFIAASLLHLYMFQNKTSFPFRPPYAIYLFPLAIMLATLGTFELFKRVPQTVRPAANGIVVVLGMALVVYIAIHTVDFKSLRKVSDWRALTSYLMSQDLSNRVVVFDGLSGYGIWEPGSYGLPRYTKARMRGVTVADIPDKVSLITRVRYEPLFVFFSYRDYYLTSRSKYSFHPRPAGDVNVDLTTLLQAPGLEIKRFTSFIVVERRAASGQLADDILYVLDRLTSGSAQTSALVEPHIAMAYLKQATGQPGVHDHVDQALALAPENKKSRVRKRLAGLSKIRP